MLLLIDATQGVEAQTLANLYVAMEHNLAIIPVINKIDLPSADIERVKNEIDHDLGLDPDQAILCSAKEGLGIVDILEAIVTAHPAAFGQHPDKPLSALIFDATVRLVPGHHRDVQPLRRDGETRATRSGSCTTGATYKVEEVGIFRLAREPRKELTAGMVGYIIAGIKTVSDTRIGDTITLDADPVRQAPVRASRR